MNNTSDNRQYLPWTWTVKSSDPNAHCPPVSSILGTFAIVNVLVSLVGLIFGNRVVYYMWILTLALQFSSNGLVASIIKNTPGYQDDFSIPQLMIFFIIRPRLSWIAMSMFSNLRRKTNEKKKSNSRVPQPAYSEPPEEYISEHPWESSFMSQFIAEIILQLINLSTTGRIAYFAATHGYYKINHEYHSLPRGAHLMYAGALLYTVALPQFLLIVPPYFLMSIRYIHRDEDEDTLNRKLAGAAQAFVWVLAVSTWLGSWLIWSGFVLLAGDLYCPPKLFQQGVIWTTFSSIGIFTGTGV